MEIIKEHDTTLNWCIIMSDRYRQSIEYVNELFQIAQEDFPGLHAKNTEVVIDTDDEVHIKMGIRFAPNGNIPDDYRKVGGHKFVDSVNK